MNEFEIVKVLSVVDTRDFDIEVDKRGEEVAVPVPGTGDPHECDRCGREHEVHATVELANGSTAIVGTGCMRGHSMLLEIRSMARLATKVKKMEAELAAYESKRVAWDAAVAEVWAMTAPDPIVSDDPRFPKAKLVTVGDEGWALCHGEVTDERLKCARDGWRRARLVELGFKSAPPISPTLKKRLAAAKAKVMAPCF